jgi:hypothetical protein
MDLSDGRDGDSHTMDGNRQWTTTRVRMRMRMRMTYTCGALTASRDPCFRWLVLPDRHCRPAALGIWLEEYQFASPPACLFVHLPTDIRRPQEQQGIATHTRPATDGIFCKCSAGPLPPSPDPGDGARLLSMTLTVNQRCHSLLTRPPRILVDCQVSFAVGMARCRGKRATTARHLLPASRGGRCPPWLDG